MVTGAGGASGRALLDRLVTAGHEVHAVDRTGGDGAAGVVWHQRDVRVGLDDVLAGADAVVHLAVPGDESTADVTRVVLDAATTAGVRRLVHRSGAVVYGAWPSNPVPLTEEHTIRPNPGFAPAAHLAESERLVEAWRDADLARVVTVLRPAVVLDARGDSELARALGPSAHKRSEPPVVQYVSADDLAAAADHVLAHDIAGLFNVAPAGWIAGGEALALGGSHRLPLPDAVREAIDTALVRLHLRRRLPGVRPLLAHPWVVASDRLQATGWTPAASSAEVIVASKEGSWWRELSPKRRQEATLAASAGGIVALVGAVAAAVGLARRRR